MDGILSILKPVGPTSHDMVRLVKRLTNAERAGHGGTLDPQASGVLPILLGHATRVSEYLLDVAKVYRATISMGATSSTYDREGEITPAGDAGRISLEAVREALPRFQGFILQRPPMFSAVKRHGQPLYKMARAGKEVERAERTVHVKRIDLLDWSPPLLTLDIECGRGTYIRSIAHELGQALGCGAYLASLERRRVGPFSIEEALTIEQLEEAAREGFLDRLLYPADLLLLHLPAAIVSDADVRAIGQGQYFHSVEFAPTSHTQCRAYDFAGEMVALLTKDKTGEMWKPSKVLLGSRIAETLGPGPDPEGVIDG